MLFHAHRVTCDTGDNDTVAGMGSSRTGLDLEDTLRTKFCGLGLRLDHGVLEHISALL